MEPMTGEESDHNPTVEPDDPADTADADTADVDTTDADTADVDTTDEVPILRDRKDHPAGGGDTVDVFAVEDDEAGGATAPDAEGMTASRNAAPTSGDGAAAAPPRDAVADEPAGDAVPVAPAPEEVASDEPVSAALDDAALGDDTLDDDTLGDDAPGAEPAGARDQSGGLAPLDPDDLAAPDPALLESDLDEGEGEIVELLEPSDMGPASTRTAGDLTAGTVLRGHPRPPQSGWRRLVYELTGGAIRPRLSRSDRERAEQVRLIRTLVTQPRRITVLSRKGGVGKTTTTLMLGQTLASERGDRIIAVDGNPDAGSLGYRVGTVRPEASITDLLNELDSVQRYADMRRFTAQTSSGLEVLRSDDDPHISTALGEHEYTAVTSLLDRFYNLILIDTGTGILDSAVQGILDGTDQIVLVVAPSLDAARAASQTLDWLSEHGFVGLVETAVTVINQSRRSVLVDVARIEEHFWDRCGATVRVPWDRYLEAGAETELADLSPATREAYRHLAAAVARRFET